MRPSLARASPLEPPGRYQTQQVLSQYRKRLLHAAICGTPDGYQKLLSGDPAEPDDKAFEVVPGLAAGEALDAAINLRGLLQQ